MAKEAATKDTIERIARAISITFVVTISFYLLYPWVTIFAIFALIPVFSDIVIYSVELPVKLFNLSLPDSDILGYKVTVAQKFWSVTVLIVTFLIIWMRNK